MSSTQEAVLLERALSNIEQLLNNYDSGGQIECALPLLYRHHRTLTKLRDRLRSPRDGINIKANDDRWADDLMTAFSELGGHARHSLLYRKMRQLRVAAGRSWPPHAKETIRQTLQAYCAESPQYRAGPDLFRMVRCGWWGLKRLKK